MCFVLPWRYDSASFGSDFVEVRLRGGRLWIGSSFVDKKLLYWISLSEAFFRERDLLRSPFLRSTRAHNLLFIGAYPLSICRGGTSHYIEKSIPRPIPYILHNKI